jgi:hypothetical protein
MSSLDLRETSLDLRETASGDARLRRKVAWMRLSSSSLMSGVNEFTRCRLSWEEGVSFLTTCDTASFVGLNYMRL